MSGLFEHESDDDFAEFQPTQTKTPVRKSNLPPDPPNIKAPTNIKDSIFDSETRKEEDDIQVISTKDSQTTFNQKPTKPITIDSTPPPKVATGFHTVDDYVTEPKKPASFSRKSSSLASPEKSLLTKVQPAGKPTKKIGNLSLSATKSVPTPWRYVSETHYRLCQQICDLIATDLDPLKLPELRELQSRRLDLQNGIESGTAGLSTTGGEELFERDYPEYPEMGEEEKGWSEQMDLDNPGRSDSPPAHYNQIVDSPPAHYNQFNDSPPAHYNNFDDSPPPYNPPTTTTTPHTIIDDDDEDGFSDVDIDDDCVAAVLAASQKPRGGGEDDFGGGDQSFTASQLTTNTKISDHEELARTDFPFSKNLLAGFKAIFGLHKFRKNQLECMNATMLGRG
eukprot:sb/3465462/